jgi:hypothetical protein
MGQYAALAYTLQADKHRRSRRLEIHGQPAPAPNLDAVAG